MGMEPTILQEVAALQRMPLKALRERWKALFGTDAPSYSAEHMVRRLAYRLQELRFGGLTDITREKLTQLWNDSETNTRSRRSKRKVGSAPAPGTRLVRLWHGRRHEVAVCHDGTFEYAGKKFRTLSAVAKAISGQHCSGPRFFGLPSGEVKT